MTSASTTSRWGTRARSGTRRRAPRGSVRITEVASPVIWPARELSIVSTSSRSMASDAASRVAARQVLVGGAVQHGAQRGRHLRAAQLHVGDVLAHVLHRHRDLVLAAERDLAGEHLVEHDAQRVDVGLAVDLVAERLLGRDVVGGAQHAAVRGQALVDEHARDAEVGHLGRPLGVDQDVLGLDVAVDDAAVVRGAQRAGDLDRVGDRLGDRQAAQAADALLERLALDVLEHDVGRRVAVVALLAGVDDLDDVRVVELGHGAGLAAEALQLVGVAGRLAMHQLDRDRPLEHGVERPVDRRHAAGADLGVEAVAIREERADEGRHRPPMLTGDGARQGQVRRGAGVTYVRALRCAAPEGRERSRSSCAPGPGL